MNVDLQIDDVWCTQIGTSFLSVRKSAFILMIYKLGHGFRFPSQLLRSDKSILLSSIIVSL